MGRFSTKFAGSFVRLDDWKPPSRVGDSIADIPDSRLESGGVLDEEDGVWT